MRRKNLAQLEARQRRRVFRLPAAQTWHVEEVAALRVVGGEGRARLPDGRTVRTPPGVKIIRVPVLDGPPKIGG
jgi:hypothetical protein